MLREFLNSDVAAPFPTGGGGWTMGAIREGFPPVDNGIRLKVRVIQHLFDVLGVDFNDKIFDSNDIKSKVT